MLSALFIIHVHMTTHCVLEWYMMLICHASDIGNLIDSGTRRVIRANYRMYLPEHLENLVLDE